MDDHYLNHSLVAVTQILAIYLRFKDPHVLRKHSSDSRDLANVTYFNATSDILQETIYDLVRFSACDLKPKLAHQSLYNWSPIEIGKDNIHPEMYPNQSTQLSDVQVIDRDFFCSIRGIFYAQSSQRIRFIPTQTTSNIFQLTCNCKRTRYVYLCLFPC